MFLDHIVILELSQSLVPFVEKNMYNVNGNWPYGLSNYNHLIVHCNALNGDSESNFGSTLKCKQSVTCSVAYCMTLATDPGSANLLTDK